MRQLALAIALLVMLTHGGPAVAGTVQATNRLHTAIMKMPRAKQAAIMKHLINSAGKTCSLVQSRKFDRYNEIRTAIHVVVCAEGTYAVVIKTDDRGTTDVIKIRS